MIIKLNLDEEQLETLREVLLIAQQRYEAEAQRQEDQLDSMSRNFFLARSADCEGILDLLEEAGK